MNNDRRLIRISFFVSMLAHALLGLLLWFQPSVKPASLAAKHQDLLEVEFVETPMVEEPPLIKPVAPTKIDGQIVEQDRSVNDEIPENAKYLSQFNQKVKEETRAPLYGKYKNTVGEGEKKGETAQEEVAAQEQQEEETAQDEKPEYLTDRNGLRVHPALDSLRPKLDLSQKPSQNAQAGSGKPGEGPAATDDHLRGVQVGLQTMLNTREFVYYSYYNRIKDRLRQYWEPAIKAKVTRIFQQGRTIASTNDKITKCVIILDAAGRLVKVQIIGASGITDLDEAAVEAFKAAAPFPNPPKGIVEKDGLIRIRWDFILEANNNNLFRMQQVARRQ